MSQVEISKERERLKSHIQVTESLSKIKVKDLEAALQKLKEQCKHPNATRHYGEYILVRCPDCDWEEWY